jgi:hypothetical protein
MNILIALATLATAAPVDVAPSAGADGMVCGVVLEASPIVRGSLNSRTVNIGVSTGPLTNAIIPVELLASTTERPPVWGDVVALPAASITPAETATHETFQQVTGKLTPGAAPCEVNGETVDPLGSLEVSIASRLGGAR